MCNVIKNLGSKSAVIMFILILGAWPVEAAKSKPSAPQDSPAPAKVMTTSPGSLNQKIQQAVRQKGRVTKAFKRR